MKRFRNRSNGLEEKQFGRIKINRGERWRWRERERKREMTREKEKKRDDEGERERERRETCCSMCQVLRKTHQS